MLSLRSRAARAVVGIAALGALAVLPAGVPAQAATGSVADSSTTKDDTRYCRLITFDKAAVIRERRGQYTLVVSGYAPYAGTRVTLEPLIYIRQPEFWGIQVLGCMEGVSLPVMTPYTVKLDITNTLGLYGIEVIGSDRTEKIRVPQLTRPIIVKPV